MTKEQTTKFINLLKGATQTTSIAIEIKRLEETIKEVLNCELCDNVMTQEDHNFSDICGDCNQ